MVEPVLDIALIDMPADATGALNFDGIDRKKFKLDPARLVYLLRWKHNAHPPDYEMVLVQDEPPVWVNTANLMLLGELRRRAPDAINWEGMPDVMSVLDAFEAAMESKTARRH